MPAIKTGARILALRVLNEVETNSAYSNISINRNLAGLEIDIRDRNLAVGIVYGVLKMKLTLDHSIAQFVKLNIAKIPHTVMNILRIGVYQMIYMDKVPDSAACNECVRITGQFGFSSLKGFVNGVLRNIARNRDLISFPKPEDGLTRYLSVKYSYPEWMVNKWLVEIGPDTEPLMRVMNEAPEVSIRVNTLRVTPEKLTARLKGRNLAVRPGTLSANVLILEAPESIGEMPEYTEGLFHVQDESSVHAVEILDPQPGETVIDVCAAPGGKSFCMAELMQNKGIVISGDIFQHKIDLISKNAARLGTSCVKARLHDAMADDPELREKADRVMVDAPCSGLGVIGRKPEIKWTRKAEDIVSLAVLQKRILDASADLVKPGGVLLYGVCTISREENEEIVEHFLAKRHDFIIDRTERLLPHIHGTDGFYAARLVREEG